jgi:hypothetical protein
MATSLVKRNELGKVAGRGKLTTAAYRQAFLASSLPASVEGVAVYIEGGSTSPAIVEHRRQVCSFLALVVLKELEARLDARGKRYERAIIRRDLKALQEVEVEKEGRMWYLRTDVHGVCNEALKAAGVAVPPAVRN